MATLGRFGSIDAREIQRDLLDNALEVIPLADVAAVREVSIEWTLELPVSHRAMTGVARLLHDNGAVDVDHHYSFVSEIHGITFGGDVFGGKIRLLITTHAVGENPQLRYKLTDIKNAT